MALQTAYKPDCEPTEYLSVILRLFREAIAKHQGKPGIAPFLFVLISRRIGAIETRILKLIAKVRAGTLRPPRPRTPRDPDKPRAPRPRRPSPVAPPPSPMNPRGEPERLPRTVGWLYRLQINPGPMSDWLRILLADPRMKALIAADPRVGRAFRPLCRMVGLNLIPEKRPQPGEVPPTPELVEIPWIMKPGKPTPFIPPPPPAQPDAYGHTRGDPKPTPLAIWGRGLVKG